MTWNYSWKNSSKDLNERILRRLVTGEPFPSRRTGADPRQAQQTSARKGSIKQAKMLTEGELEKLLEHVARTSRQPDRDRLAVLLSVRQGLRVCEIAGLSLDDVVDASGRLDGFITIRSGKSKSRDSRRIPLHPQVRDALVQFRKRHPSLLVFMHSSKDDRRPLSTNALTVWFWETYKAVGLKGCSSHSGRRTWITGLAERVAHFGGSLRDVQVLAGHQRLDTTEKYIEPTGNHRAMINSLGAPRGTERPAQLDDEVYETWYDRQPRHQRTEKIDPS